MKQTLNGFCINVTAIWELAFERQFAGEESAGDGEAAGEGAGSEAAGGEAGEDAPTE